MSPSLRTLALVALLAASTACGTPSASLTLDAKDTLADGRKVLRLGDHPVARLARYGYAFDREDLSCTPAALVSSDPTVLRIAREELDDTEHVFHLEPLRQGDTRLVASCGQTLLTLDVHVTCAAD